MYMVPYSNILKQLFSPLHLKWLSHAYFFLILISRIGNRTSRGEIETDSSLMYGDADQRYLQHRLQDYISPKIGMKSAFNLKSLIQRKHEHFQLF